WIAGLQERIEEGGKDPMRPMPHSFECLIPGTILVGGFEFKEGITEEELQAWRSGVMFSCEGVAPDGGLVTRVGGKTARGFGRVSMHLYGEISEGIEAPVFHDTQSLISGLEPDESLKSYASTLKDLSEEFLSVIGEASK